jgi:cyanophycin synthetase
VIAYRLWARARNLALRALTGIWIRPRVARMACPLIAITGTTGKTTVALLLARIYQAAGYRVGLACSDGVQVNRPWVRRGDQAGSPGLWRLLSHRPLDIIVAETARGGIIRYGLGFHHCDVGVVTNIDADHLGDEGLRTLDDLARVKGAVPACATVRVLNADDPRVRAMASGDTLFFSAEGRSDFPKGWLLRDGRLCSKRGDGVMAKFDARAIALSWRGAAAFQVANVLAALSVIDALQERLPVADPLWQDVLTEFGSETSGLGDRRSVIHRGDTDILVARANNPREATELARTIAALRARGGHDRVVCKLTACQYEPDLLRSISRALAEACDHFIVGPPDAPAFSPSQRAAMVEVLVSALPPDRVLQRAALTMEMMLERVARTGARHPLLVISCAALEPDVDLGELLERRWCRVSETFRH